MAPSSCEISRVARSQERIDDISSRLGSSFEEARLLYCWQVTP